MRRPRACATPRTKSRASPAAAPGAASAIARSAAAVSRATRQLARIRALGIPPAWKQVWICADERGHLQATGRDVRGRKQYLYHADWRAVRDAAKFDRMLDFGSSLPRLRDHIESDLGLPGLQRERVLAAVVRLVDETLIRVGNEAYRRDNGSIGATTMRARHAAGGRPDDHDRVQGQVRQAAPLGGRRPPPRADHPEARRSARAASSSSTSVTPTANAARCARTTSTTTCATSAAPR